MPATLQVERVQFFDEHPLNDQSGKPAYPGCDGAVWYLSLTPCKGIFGCESGCRVACASHPGLHHCYLMQPFSRSGQGLLVNRTEWEKANNRANIWAWNGNREAPTLSPSFLCYGDGQYLPRVHLFLNNGRIDLCSDSECISMANPVPCKEPETTPE